ncbi:MAG: hypothetical protein AAFR38_12890 [Planctomycetota bacterium]
MLRWVFVLAGICFAAGLAPGGVTLRVSDRYAEIEATGVIGEEITARAMADALGEARRRGARAVYLSVDSPGGYMYEAESLLELFLRGREERSLVVSIGPSGAAGAGLVFVAVADRLAVQPHAAIRLRSDWRAPEIEGAREVEGEPDLESLDAWAWRLGGIARDGSLAARVLDGLTGETGLIGENELAAERELVEEMRASRGRPVGSGPQRRLDRDRDERATQRSRWVELIGAIDSSVGSIPELKPSRRGIYRVDENGYLTPEGRRQWRASTDLAVANIDRAGHAIRELIGIAEWAQREGVRHLTLAGDRDLQAELASLQARRRRFVVQRDVRRPLVSP